MARTLTFEAIGTQWVIDIFCEVSNTQFEVLSNEVHRVIDQFDKDWSRFRPDSFVSHIRQNPGMHTLPRHGYELLVLYENFYHHTSGKMTPLIGELLEQAGYDATYSFQPKTLVAVPTWKESLSYTKETVTLLQPVLLDFGAIGKGYLIDLVSEVVAQFAPSDYCVDAGGDIRLDVASPLRIGLENPSDTTQAIGYTEITHGSMCASAGNRRRWAEHHHIMHPGELRSVNNVTATWVIAETAALADAIATALFFTPCAVLRSTYNFEAVIYYPNNECEVTNGFPGEIFTQERIK